MSAYVIGHVLRHNRTARGVARNVLIVLADHAHSDGSNSFPSLSTIAAEACCSRSYVVEALRELEAQGAIERTGTGHRSVTIWRVVMDPAPAAAGPPPETDDQSCQPTSNQSGQTTSPASRLVGSPAATSPPTGPEPSGNRPNSSPPSPPEGGKRPEVDPDEVLELPAPATTRRRRDRQRADEAVAATARAFAARHFADDEIDYRLLPWAAQRLHPDVPPTARALRAVLEQIGWLTPSSPGDQEAAA